MQVVVLKKQLLIQIYIASQRLGTSFIIQMHVSIPKGKTSTLLASLESNPALHEFRIQATELNSRCYKSEPKAVIGMQIHCVGRDRLVDDQIL